MPDGSGAAAERGEHLVRLERRAVVELDRRPRRAASPASPDARAARRRRPPRARRAPGRRRTAPRARSAGRRGGRASPSSRRPTTPGPSRRRRRRRRGSRAAPAPRFAVVASMFVHGRASRSPSMSGISAAEPVATITAFRATSSSVAAPRDDPPLAVEPPAAADERDAVLLEPRQLTRVVEVRDHLVAPREHGRHVDRPDLEAGDARDLALELDRAQQRLRRHAGVVRALAADEPVLDDRDRERRSAPACRPPPRRRRRPPAPPRRTRARSLPSVGLTPGFSPASHVLEPNAVRRRAEARRRGSSASAGRSPRP